jgi:hypothetical protein
MIWVVLGVLTLYFVVSRNGDFVLDGGIPQMASTAYAILAAFTWGAYRLISTKKSSSTLFALIMFASIFVVMFLTKYFFSPTQIVAVIALFYYSSKILAYTFKS